MAARTAKREAKKAQRLEAWWASVRQREREIRFGFRPGADTYTGTHINFLHLYDDDEDLDGKDGEEAEDEEDGPDIWSDAARAGAGIVA